MTRPFSVGACDPGTRGTTRRINRRTGNARAMTRRHRMPAARHASAVPGIAPPDSTGIRGDRLRRDRRDPRDVEDSAGVGEWGGVKTRNGPHIAVRRQRTGGGVSSKNHIGYGTKAGSARDAELHRKYPASLAGEDLEATAPVPKSALAWSDLADRRIVCEDMRSRPGVGLHGGNSDTAQRSFSLVGQRQMD